MHKPELISAIADHTSMTKEQASHVLTAILDEIQLALSREGDVVLIGFGTFSRQHRKARIGKNPQTGQPIEIPATNTVSFKAGKKLKEIVNG
ncbi:HU family DNA-binding protein [Zooshikella ganghwensis]|uniref:HU family DNA-binding protein n=1 Tax=Zooshikella ganghwensis TaxID=202772 RepID=A0A4P9VHX1_9GAMM|nr:HU family DNA-binding protein [Zooshikella ganghwensis]RDH42106.1 HU family DNA-binding protein [Zooshikella ganghwensis]